MPEPHAAIAFLQQLDPASDATFNIETFADRPKGAEGGPRADMLTRRFPGLTLARVAVLLPTLEQLNQSGAGIFLAVNCFEGQRSKRTLARVRGVHADFDGAPRRVLDAVRERLQPTLEVETSGPGNWHFYWLLKEGEKLASEIAESINRGLVGLGADPAATDLSRLLRLPGFRHMKNREQRA